MYKYSFLLLVFCGIVSCQSEPRNETTSNTSVGNKPNIVLLIGDDQGYPYFGFMGADYVHTPNMDQLAASGTLFKNGYVPSNHCRPSLQSLMTGTLPIDYERAVERKLSDETTRIRFESAEAKAKWEQNFRHHAMQHFETLPKMLSKAGYASFQGGKWWEYHFENGGFTHGMTTGWTPAERKNGGKWFKQFMGGDGLKLARATMEPVYDFITANQEQPFFIWYAPELPHYPFDAPQKYYEHYQDKEMTESAKRYYANCTWFDDGVGELMGFLKERELFDNTLFVYVNDNGWEQNPDQEFRHDSLRWHNGGDKGKLSMFDQSFHTPIIFSWKGGIRQGVQLNELVHSTDIPATILDYLDLTIPENFHGKSLKERLAGKGEPLREMIIGNIDQVRSEEDMMGQKLEGYWLRDKDWFFNWRASDGMTALYNMEEDPNNDRNMANEEPAKSALFLGVLQAWKDKKKDAQ